ncbi:hypothetical protein [Micromonospora sp. NPDC050200]|uniref:hypothetical protein n=1 Tax=Micromonospora sp. NPDC050200 TaxID=3155664 RepID=UPI003409E104
MAAVVAPAVLLLWGVSVPGGYFDVLVAALVAWSLVGMAWLVVGVSNVVALPRPRRRRLGRLWPLLLVPTVFAASWTAASGDLVGRATFSVHRSELERVAVEEAATPSLGHGDVGLYSFESISRAQGCVLFGVRDPGMARGAGFAWCPGRVPMNDDAEGFVFEPFDGDWYVFLVRHGLWKNRFQGARPWGLQITELNTRTPT